MRAAKVGKVTGRLELEAELIAHSMQTGIPVAAGVARSARGSAMITGVPYPFDFVSHFNRDGTRRKGIAARADTDGICLRERDLS
jgi:hypothetical protein